MIQHYIKIGIRHLLKHKTQNIISTIGLAVALLCFSLCFYISRFMGSVDKAFIHHDRLVELSLTSTDGKIYSGTPYRLLKELRQREWVGVETFTSISFLRKRPYNIQIDHSKLLPYTLETMEVDSLYDRLFTPTILEGSWKSAVNSLNAVVLTESAARRMFPHLSDAIGKQMVLTNHLSTSPSTTPQAGGIAYTIQAVIKDLPANASMHFMKQVDMLTLNDSEGTFQVKDAAFTGATTYALLKEGKTVKDLSQELEKANLQISVFNDNEQVSAFPIGEREDIKSIISIFMLVTSSAGLLVLLTGLLNFFHFQSGSFLNRYREFTLRRVLGNNTKGLFMMQFIQLSMIVLLAVLLTGCLAEVFSPSFNLSLFKFHVQIDKRELLGQLVQYLGLLLLLSALIGLCIAFYIRRMVAKGHRVVSGNNKNRLRNTLLGVQFFICWLFISLTVGLYLQSEVTTNALYDTLNQKDKKEIIGFSLSYTFMKHEEKLALINRIRSHSGVKEVLPVDVPFTKGVSGNGLYEENNKKDSYIEVSIISIPPKFLSFMNLPLVSGHPIENGNEILVSRGFAEKQKENILGKVFYNWEQKGYTVVGVVDHFNTYIYNDGFGQMFSQCAYFPSELDKYVGYCYLKCHPGQEEAVHTVLYNLLRETLPESVEPEIASLFNEIQGTQEIENKLKNIVLFFAAVCLVITLLSVYSAITLDTERRQKEVAIRKVNGAGVKQIIILFSRLYALLMAISAMVAFPLVFIILLQWKTMYKVFFNDGILYWGSIFLTVLLLTAFTVMFRIQKMTRLNPSETIKNE